MIVLTIALTISLIIIALTIAYMYVPDDLLDDCLTIVLKICKGLTIARQLHGYRRAIVRAIAMALKTVHFNKSIVIPVSID